MNTALVLAAFWLPGLAFGAAIRLRGWTLAAAAPVLTFGLVALGIYALGNLGIAWTLVNVVLWSLVVSAAALAGSLLLARRRAATGPRAAVEGEAPHRSLRDHLLIGGGVAAGMAVGVVTFLDGIGGLNSVHQEWDAPFHANLVRWIAEHDSALPSAIGAVANAANDSNYFYPNVYHALLALTFGPVGMPELLGLGVLSLLLALPLGIAALATRWRMPTLAVASAAAVSTWFSALPYDLSPRGPLWPYMAGAVLVPAVLAMAKYLVVPRGVAGILGVAVGIVGLVGLHTSMLFVIAPFAVLLLLALALRLEPIDWRVARWHFLGATVFSLALAMLWIIPVLDVAGGVATFTWESQASVVAGFGQMITFSPDAELPQWWVGMPALVGMVLLYRHRRMVWIVGAYLLWGALYAATVSMESDLIHALSAPFYNDHWRIAALIPIAGAIGFGQFISSVGEWSADYVVRWRPAWSGAPVATLAAITTVLVIAVLGNGAYIERNSSRLASAYPGGPTVTDGERSAYAWLAEHVGSQQRVMNDFRDGSVWMYALAGVKPVEWIFGGTSADSSASLLTRQLDELREDGPIRRALNELDVRYVIVGEGFIRNRDDRAEGLRQLESNPNFHVVYRNPDAVIYEIEGQQDVVQAASGTHPGASSTR